MDDKTLVSVKNRNNGFTGYNIPDMHIWRNFAPGETKKISLGELRQLQYQPGGEYTLMHLLMVDNRDALSALNMTVEPEYNYTESDIREMLLNGTVDQVKDFLDFAPEGAIEIAKTIAVKEEIPDVRKRQAITEATGFNVDSAINVNHIMDTEETKEEPKKERRVTVTPKAEDATQKQRRTTTYKVVEKKEN